MDTVRLLQSAVAKPISSRSIFFLETTIAATIRMLSMALRFY
jgi:hypothetical protein